METHFCKKCQTDKAVSEFSIVKRTYKNSVYLNFQSGCKSCINKHHAERKHTYKPRERAQARERCLEWKLNKNPVSWGDFKKESIIDEYKEYPIHCCGRRYIETLGCLLCERDALVVMR